MLASAEMQLEQLSRHKQQLQAKLDHLRSERSDRLAALKRLASETRRHRNSLKQDSQAQRARIRRLKAEVRKLEEVAEHSGTLAEQAAGRILRDRLVESHADFKRDWEERIRQLKADRERDFQAGK